jgi:hypothetical protein
VLGGGPCLYQPPKKQAIDPSAVPRDDGVASVQTTVLREAAPFCDIAITPTGEQELQREAHNRVCGWLDAVPLALPGAAPSLHPG